MQITKKELQEKLDACRDKLNEDQRKRYLLQQEVERLKVQAEVHAKEMGSQDASLGAIRQVIRAALRVRHDVNVTKDFDYSQAPAVSAEQDDSEDKRFLRHLYQLAESPPTH